MSKPRYFITDRNGVLGILWENENLGKVLVLENKNEIDFNQDIEVRDFNGVVNHIDLRDFLYEIIPGSHEPMNEPKHIWDEWLENVHRELEKRFADIIIEEPHPSEYLSSYNEIGWYLEDVFAVISKCL